ncbi:MAG: hypothetical protein V4507_07165 [Verrucomicrobiota bacterium]
MKNLLKPFYLNLTLDSEIDPWQVFESPWSDYLKKLESHISDRKGVDVSLIGGKKSDGSHLILPRINFDVAKSVFKHFGIFSGLAPDSFSSFAATAAFIEFHSGRSRRHVEDYRLSIYPISYAEAYLRGFSSALSDDLGNSLWKGDPDPSIGILEREIVVQQFDGVIRISSDSVDSIKIRCSSEIVAQQVVDVAITEDKGSWSSHDQVFLEPWRTDRDSLMIGAKIKYRPLEIHLVLPEDADTSYRATQLIFQILILYRHYFAIQGDL